jgi:hypothetical protein
MCSMDWAPYQTAEAPVPLTAADYISGRDAVFEAVLAGR